MADFNIKKSYRAIKYYRTYIENIVIHIYIFIFQDHVLWSTIARLTTPTETPPFNAGGVVYIHSGVPLIKDILLPLFVLKSFPFFCITTVKFRIFVHFFVPH